MVRVLTVTESRFAITDMFLGSSTPIASMICISLLVMSLYSSVITAFASMSITWLNRLISNSFMERLVFCTIYPPLSSPDPGPDPSHIIIMYSFRKKSQ